MDTMVPDSVEEAAALLGASITRCGGAGSHAEAVLPPVGMHPAFAVVTTNSTTEIIHRLYMLRSLLRTVAVNYHQQQISGQKNESATSSTAPPPLPSAPSILQVLKKLLGVSTQLAATAASSAAGPATSALTVGSATNSVSATSATGDGSVANSESQPSSSKQPRRLVHLKNKHETPPMWSTPCRGLWVDCVVLCFVLSTSSSSSSTQELTQFVRQMLGLASIHPRSAKAAGGVRIAALAVMAALFEYDANDSVIMRTMSTTIPTSPQQTLDYHRHRRFIVASTLAPWSLDVLQVCLKALRSAGTGEPTFRQAAIQAACATAKACRQAAWRHRLDQEVLAARDSGSGGGTVVDTTAILQSLSSTFYYSNAMEDKAIVESVKVLKQAATDKFPEIRHGAATLAATLAPLLITAPSSGSGSGSSNAAPSDVLAALEEVVQLALRNLDDEYPVVAAAWADAVARCLTTALQYNEGAKKLASEQRGDSNAASGGSGTGDGVSPTGTASQLSPASRFGARKPVGLVYTMTTIKRAIDFLVDQFVVVGGDLAAARAGGTSSAGGRMVRLGYSVALTQFLQLQTSVLSTIGESQSISIHATITCVLNMVGKKMEDHLKAASGTRTWSKADSGLARLLSSRVVRRGLSQLGTEPFQLSVLQELVGMLPKTNESETAGVDSNTHTANQLQVILVEVSHLFATLGEAAASYIDDTLTKLLGCLSHHDGGVRSEASIACTAVVASFPSQGPTLIESCNKAILTEFAQVGSMGAEKVVEAKGSMPGFLRSGKQASTPQIEPILSYKFTIHGRSLLVSMLVRDLTTLPMGLSRETLTSVLSIAETLVSSQLNEDLTAINAAAVCACVRAGFCMISGVLSTGPASVGEYMPQIIGVWQRAGKASKVGSKNFTLQHDLDCLDALLSSVVAFLKFGSELLLTVPEALSQVTILLEDMFQLVQPSGRLGSPPGDPQSVALLESSKAALLETFAWLPSGSFPLVADEVFSFAATHIRHAVEKSVSCSILYSLISKEDAALDSKPFSRANKDGQVGGARDIEEIIVLLNGEIASHDEQESVVHLRSKEPGGLLGSRRSDFRESSILKSFVSDTKVDKPPTPLHEVGTWRRPVDPSVSSKVRIIDAAIQAFSSTFGLKDGKEQQGAMDMLEQLIPRSLGIGAVTAENERRSKARDDVVAIVNVTAVLLSCLQALPLHEATHNIPIGLGPPWMNKAKDLLLNLLPSPSSIVRRAAAEGLALLATLGVTEDAHFLQSSLLHSLDEVMQGNKLEGKTRGLTLEPVSASRAGSLLTLACIQRTSHNVAQRKRIRARGRIVGSKTDEAVDKSNENLPVLQMMTRILPSASCHGAREYFAVKTYGLHSFAVLLIYSSRLTEGPIGEEDRQLLRKAVELVEDNFSSAWTSASVDLDRGQEAEKMVFEASFLAVLVRFMSFLLPFLDHIQIEDQDVTRRFSVMATIVLERYGTHPSIALEALAFFEVLASNAEILPTASTSIISLENPLFSCIPYVLHALAPQRPSVSMQSALQTGRSADSRKCLQAVAYLAHMIPKPKIWAVYWNDILVVSFLVATLESVCGSRYFSGSSSSCATNRGTDALLAEDEALEKQITHSVYTALQGGASSESVIGSQIIRWPLLARQLLTRFSPGTPTPDTTTGSKDQVVAKAISQAVLDSSIVYNTAAPVRWQTKCIASQIGAESLRQILDSERKTGCDARQSPQFDVATATTYLLTKSEASTGEFGSRVAFHLEDLVASACMSSVATIDQAELYQLQESSAFLLRMLIDAFGPVIDPEDPSSSILNQYATQIFASVKHSLAPSTGHQPELSSRLFIAGCKSLFCAVKSGFASDPLVMIRLIRPLMLQKETFRVAGYSPNYQSAFSHHVEGSKSILLPVRVGTIWVLSLLLAHPKDYLKDVAKEIVKDKLGVAVEAAATSIEACHLLYSENLSLVGVKTSESVSSGSGFHNHSDFDKATLAGAWSQCCVGALQALLQETTTSESDEARMGICTSWIKALLPLVLAGINDTLLVPADAEKSANWASQIDIHEVLLHCLQGVKLVVGTQLGLLATEFGMELQRTIELLFDRILMPAILPVDTRDTKKYHIQPTHQIASEVCSLIILLSDSGSTDTPSVSTALLILLLKPMNLLQKGEVEFGSDTVEEVVSSCLMCFSNLIRQGRASETVSNAALHLSTNELLNPSKVYPDKCRSAGRELLATCLSHGAMSRQGKEDLAAQLALSETWDGWVVVAAHVDDGAAVIGKSLRVVEEVIRNPGKSESLAGALSAIRSICQSGPPEVAGLILHAVGSDVVAALYLYGTMKMVPHSAHSYRVTVCADSLKIVLVAYDLIARREDSEEQLLTFVHILLTTLLAVIRFNGLPNHASPEPLSDAALGRIGAQAIVHVARTTPAAFKSCVALLTDAERPLLEFAVRAEMSGYAVGGTATSSEPTKKKLNLQGYRK